MNELMMRKAGTNVFAGGTVETVAQEHSPAEKLRKPVSTIVAAATIVAIWAVAPTRNVYGRLFETEVSFLLVCAAVLGRGWCSLYISGRKNTELCETGPYSVCRNPLYLFSSLGLAGVLLATHRPAVAAGVWMLFWVFYIFVIRGEEARLYRRFGDEFARYCSRVPRVGVRFSTYMSAPTILVTLRPLLRAFADVSWFFIAWMLVYAATSVT